MDRSCYQGSAYSQPFAIVSLWGDANFAASGIEDE